MNSSVVGKRVLCVRFEDLPTTCLGDLSYTKAQLVQEVRRMKAGESNVKHYFHIISVHLICAITRYVHGCKLSDSATPIKNELTFACFRALKGVVCSLCLKPTSVPKAGMRRC